MLEPPAVEPGVEPRARSRGAAAPSAPARSLAGSNCSTKFRRGGVSGGERRVELADAVPLDRE